LKAPLDTHLNPISERTPQFWRNNKRPNGDSRSFEISSSPLRSASQTPDILQHSPSSIYSTSSSSHEKHEQATISDSDLSFTYFAFKRTPCTCIHYNHLCPPCGRDLIAQDRVYESGWTWRNKYSAYVGVAEGNKGVECGRRSACLAARLVEQETDCNASDLQEMDKEATGRSWEGGGFVAQEVEGVGGIVKMKVKKLVLVGAEVDGLDDDVGDDDSYCKKAEKRLQKGERSWCSWCERVVPGANDVWDRAWDIGGDSK
jgi:hypothetical protein